MTTSVLHRVLFGSTLVRCACARCRQRTRTANINRSWRTSDDKARQLRAS